MRRTILIAILSLCGFTAAAQELFSQEDERLFYGGLQLGANFSQVDGDGFSGYRKVGIAGGGLVLVRPFRIAGLSLGLGYAQKGSHEARITETAIGPAVFRYRMHLQYAEVPLLLHLFPGGRFQYSAGISYSRLISANEESESINPIKIDPELYPFLKQDWSTIVAINWRIYGQWFLSGQYQYTIGSIRSEPFIPPGYGAGRQRNNVMALRLVYFIGSGSE
jgi:hypothetical protein